jgi:hypothetical protein
MDGNLTQAGNRGWCSCDDRCPGKKYHNDWTGFGSSERGRATDAGYAATKDDRTRSFRDRAKTDPHDRRDAGAGPTEV